MMKTKGQVSVQCGDDDRRCSLLSYSLERGLPVRDAAKLAAVQCLLGILMACGGSGETPCESEEDCFSNEICYDGYCQPARPNGVSNSASAQLCTASDGCASGVEEFDGGDAYFFRAGDESELRYGCEPFAEEDFLGVQERTLEITACPNSHHRMLVPVYTCSDRAFTVDVILRPVTAQCSLDDWTDNIDFSVTSAAVECGGSITTNCHNTHQIEDGYHWEAVFDRVSHSSSRTEIRPRLDLYFSADAGFEYEVVVSVSEF